MSLIAVESQKSYFKLINALSIIIPIAVALMLGLRMKFDLGEWTKALPHLNAIINTLTSILLVLAFVFIKQKNIKAHQWSMLSAFSLGAVFLITYILYHISNESTPYGGEGTIRYVYFFFLISHIVLSIVVVRFVLLALYYSLSGQFKAHKRVTKIAFPIWLYVSVSGVIVYLMISPYYQ